MMKIHLAQCALAVLASAALTHSLAVPKLGQDLQHPLVDYAPSDAQAVHEALLDAELIPDVFDDFEPSFVITPYYPASNTTVELGNRVKPEAVSSRPDLYMSMVKPTETVKANGTYTLVLSDPDATSQADPAKAQMCHWILTNMTLPESNVQHAGSVNLGSVLTLSGNEGIFELESYAPPAPPPKTGYHRYVFALLTSDSIPERPKDRPHWGYGKIGTGIREWAADNDMTVVGANFFHAQNKKQ